MPLLDLFLPQRILTHSTLLYLPVSVTLLTLNLSLILKITMTLA